jgi:CBS domain-containing protein
MNLDKVVRKDVVPLRPEDGIAAGWRSMREQRLGGLPVVDARGRLVGVLTEADLIVRRIPTRTSPWWRTMLAGSEGLADDYRKVVGITVEDVMTRETLALALDDSPEAATRLMHEHRRSILPVVADGNLVGVVTSADLIDDLPWPSDVTSPGLRDAELLQAMRERMAGESWTSGHRVYLGADHGVLSLCGVVEGPAERAGLLAMARAIAGRHAVEDHLLVRSQLPRRRT